jgi:predicted nucleotide-binding protein (sugar kinase/HSP70/actin superfamily)
MSYPTFTKAMKKDYTILIPDMLPIHFTLFSYILNQAGYHSELLHLAGSEVKEEGLRNVHNDACYPALLVTGQFIAALKSGKYDPHKTAVLISQTGGGCRASNYIFLIRKALAPLYPDVPVLSFNFSGLEKGNSLKLSPFRLLQFLHAALYGDLLMALMDQTRPYEQEKGQCDALLRQAIALLEHAFKNHTYWQRKRLYRKLIKLFSVVPIPEKRKPRVGIVGEIYVKYSPLANNHLVDFLLANGTEPVEPGLLEFCLYCAVNAINDHRWYGLNKKSVLLWKLGYRLMRNEAEVQNRLLAKNGHFLPSVPWRNIQANANRIINEGVKMGEGWLIPSEMVAFAEHGVPNIVCCQPFGCLPNHIVGKGMMRPVRQLCPDANIAAIDYDPSTSYVNQENRLKLMLANIKENKI